MPVVTAQANAQVLYGVVVNPEHVSQVVCDLIFIRRFCAVVHKVVAVEHKTVKAGDDLRLITPGSRLSPEAYSRVVPGGRENCVFSFRPVYGEKVEGLVGIVQASHGNHKMAHPQIEGVGEGLLEPELLQFHLASFLYLGLPFTCLGEFLFYGRTRSRVLELDFCLH